ncbi:Major facilitator superfamily domain general substrate transporter [Penicillium expansum]|nr:Major facilitator superfamily domain general substrate transporter [Penicillium expansum]
MSDISKTLVVETTSESREEFLASFSSQEEKQIRRKVDKRFLLLIGLMYMVKQIDVNNVSSIKVLQVGKQSNILNELHMSADQYNWVSSIYMIAYIIFETPSNLLLKKMTPRLWQTRIFFTWGIVLACQAAVQNRQGLLALRFLLAMLETGSYPGILTQLNSWYPSDEMATPVAWLLGYMDGVRGLSAWRWVFIIEGIITVLFSGVIFLVLPDYPKSPRSSKWLSLREQEFIEARLGERAPKTADPAFSKKEILAALRSPIQWSFTFSQMLINLGMYALQWYLPTLTTSFGFTKLPANQLLNIPPAATGIIGVVLGALVLRQVSFSKPIQLMVYNAGIIIAFILFFVVSAAPGLYVACMLGTFFVNIYYIPFISWRSATMRGATGTAFAWGLQNSIGQLGGVIGPQLFQSKWAYNRYKTSFGIALAGVITAIASNLACWWWTKKQEEEELESSSPL